MDDDRIQAAPRQPDDEGFPDAETHHVSAEAVWQAVTPLRMIFWGGLLCLFDLTFTQTTNGQGFKFDILNDALGAILIAIGVGRLSALPVNPRYGSAMKFVLIVTVLSVFDAIREHFIMPLPDVVSFALGLFSLVCLAAIVVFCMAMRWFCESADLWRTATSWRMTTTLFVLIYALPLGCLYLAGLAAMATGQSFHFNLGPAGLLILPVFAAPLIHLFISTSRMIREAETYVPDSENYEDETIQPAGLAPLPNLRQPPSAGAPWLILILVGVLLFLLLGCLGWVFYAKGSNRPVSQHDRTTSAGQVECFN